MKQGHKVKLPSWGGYWYWDPDKSTVMMRTKEGNVLDIRETKVVAYTLLNVADDRWVLADETNTPILGGVATFGFDEAIKYLKRGLQVTRKGWNGKNQFIFLVKGTDLQNILKYGYGEYVNEPTIVSALAIKTSSNQIQIGWLASQTDMLADDWMFTE